MDSRRRSRQLLLWPLLAVVGAYLTGMLVGGLLLAVLSVTDTSNDAWAGLGHVILSFFVGFCVAVISWVGGLVWVARRLFARGNRAGVIVSSVAAVVATVTAIGLAVGVLDGTGAPRGLWVLGLLVLGAPSLVFRLWRRRVGPVSGGHPWLDVRSGLGPMSSDQAVGAPATFRGETEWRPEG